MSRRRERIRARTTALWNDTKYASVGLEFGVSIALCCWVGRWAQERWDFAPWGVFIGVILGFTAGLRRLIKIADIESQSYKPPPLPTTDPSQDLPIDTSYESEPHYDSSSDPTISTDSSEP